MDYKKLYEESQEENEKLSSQIDMKMICLTKADIVIEELKEVIKKQTEENAELEKRWEEHTDDIVETYFANSGNADITQKELDNLNEQIEDGITLKIITDTWKWCYGENMNEEHPGFIEKMKDGGDKLEDSDEEDSDEESEDEDDSDEDDILDSNEILIRKFLKRNDLTFSKKQDNDLTTLNKKYSHYKIKETSINYIVQFGLHDNVGLGYSSVCKKLIFKKP